MPGQLSFYGSVREWMNSTSHPYELIMRSAVLVVLLLANAINLAAQSRDVGEYVRFLIPMETSSTEGANGSRWETRMFIRNDGDIPLDVFPLSPDGCPVSIGCRQTVRRYPALAPRTTAVDHNPSPKPSYTCHSSRGCFLYVEREKIDQLSMQLHVRDSVHSPGDLTRLPIVSEAEFFESSRSIVSVPVGTGARISLRLYTLTPDSPAEFIVRIYDASMFFNPLYVMFGPPRLLAETRVATVVQAQNCGFWWGCPVGIPYQPGYASIADLLSLSPDISTAKPNGIRVEIEPVEPGVRYWPMVTVTSNLTNRLSVFTVR